MQNLYNKLAILRLLAIVHKIRIMLEEVENTVNELKEREEDKNQLDLFKE